MSSKIGILYGKKDHWREEPRDGVYEKETPEYIASIRKDEPSYPEGYFTDHKYDGEIEEGKPHGNGTWTMSNGATYVGQWSNGRREGLGTFTWSMIGPASGKSYEGMCKNNKRHGKGKMINEADIKTGYEGGVEEGYWVKINR